MKQIVTMVTAGIVGGMITLGGFQLFLANSDSTTQQLQMPNAYAQLASNKTNNVPFDFTIGAARSMPAVVHITAKQTKPKTPTETRPSSPFDLFGGDLDFFFGPSGRMPKEGTGSGVIIESEGYIVTNNHVVDFADEVTVTLYDQRKFKAKIIGTDPSTDLALLKIEGEDLPTLPFENSDEVKVGEWVLAVGNPFNLTSTVTAGIVSAKGRNIDILEGRTAIESFIQTDAAVNPGNSGGALVDVNGNLIGINTAIASSTGSFAGYSFAIPSNMVKKVVEDLKEYGSAQRGFMGISIQSMDSDLAKQLGLGITEGVHIAGVETGGAAEKAGIETNDVVTEVNGRKVRTAPELQEIVGRNRPGDELEITVNRKGKTKLFSVRLEGSEKE